METIDYFLQRYQEHLQRKATSEKELQYMVETYKKGLLRANDKLEMAGSIRISGNDSRPSGHKGLASDGEMEFGHGQDEWVPVTLELGGKTAAQNGNGHAEAEKNVNVMRVNGDNAKSQGRINSSDNSSYDAIRKANTAEDVTDEELGSGSASSGLPTKDYNVKAFSSDGEAIVGLDDEEEVSGQFIKLGNFTVPLKDKTEEKTPVEAD